LKLKQKTRRKKAGNFPLTSRILQEVDHKIYEIVDKPPTKKTDLKAINKKICKKVVNEKIKTLRRLNKNILNTSNCPTPDSGSARKIKNTLKQDVINTKRKKK